MMKIYRVTIKLKRERFMESPLIFTEELHVIADSYDQAIKFARDRMVFPGQEELDLKYERVMTVPVFFDVRDGEEKIIV